MLDPERWFSHDAAHLYTLDSVMADNDGSGLIEGNACNVPSDLRLCRLRGCSL